MRTLKRGSTGENVKRWQRFLLGEGYTIDIDGKFGPQTEQITKVHQESCGYEATGVVDDLWWGDTEEVTVIAWGKKVSKEFIKRMLHISWDLDVDANYLMACMAFESARTFSPSIRNAAGSGATGLIQFMPSTAQALGTTTDKLAKMSAVAQLEYVERYFQPSAGRLKTLEDVYMAILWPGAVGKSLNYVLFDKTDPKYPKRYIQNAGLDIDKNGKITKAEAARKVREMLELGLQPDNALYFV